MTTARRALIGALALIAFFAAIGAIVYYATDLAVMVTGLRELGARWWAPLVYIALYALFAVLLIPPQPLSIAAVVLWGWAAGATIELIAGSVGSILPWLITRSAARPWIEARLPRHQRFRELLRREGFSLLLVLRLVPILPYSLLNYIAGFSSIRPGAYFVATIVGMIPSTFIFAYFVDALMQGMMRPREVFWRIVIAGSLLAVMVVATRIAMRRMQRRFDG